MSRSRDWWWRRSALVVLVVMGAAMATACDSGEPGTAGAATQTQQPAATAAATAAPAAAPTAAPTAAPAKTEAPGGLALVAASASPTVDGSDADWASIDGVPVVLKQFDIPAGSDWEYDGKVEPKDAVVKVAANGERIYVLLEVDDSFDYVADDHGLSAALAIQFLIENAAGPHMGSGTEDMQRGLGMVDIWHWELDCAAGELSGGGVAGSGDDPECNMDDEYATDPETREDDDQAGAENSLAASWSHTATAIGADGTWIFEMSRPLDTGDSTDARFAAGSTVRMAIAYWDPKESATGWSDAGHLTSADAGWISVTLP